MRQRNRPTQRKKNYEISTKSERQGGNTDREKKRRMKKKKGK